MNIYRTNFASLKRYFFTVLPIMPIHELSFQIQNFLSYDTLKCQTCSLTSLYLWKSNYVWKSGQFSQNQFYLKCYLKLERTFLSFALSLSKVDWYRLLACKLLIMTHIYMTVDLCVP